MTLSLNLKHLTMAIKPTESTQSQPYPIGALNVDESGHLSNTSLSREQN